MRLIINYNLFDHLCDHASIHAAESGADREFCYDLEEYQTKFISERLMTENWEVIE